MFTPPLAYWWKRVKFEALHRCQSSEEGWRERMNGNRSSYSFSHIVVVPGRHPEFFHISREIRPISVFSSFGCGYFQHFWAMLALSQEDIGFHEQWSSSLSHHISHFHSENMRSYSSRGVTVNCRTVHCSALHIPICIRAGITQLFRPLLSNKFYMTLHWESAFLESVEPVSSSNYLPYLNLSTRLSIQNLHFLGIISP